MAKNKAILFCMVILFPLAMAVSPLFASSELDEGIKNLAEQISTKMSTSKKKKIAIVEFSRLDFSVNFFCLYLAEELITQLTKESSKQFDVIERRMLINVLKEQKLTMSGLLNDAKALESVGHLLGIDAILTGSATDLGNEIKVNARLIGVDTAEIYASGSTTILKDENVTRLWNKKSFEDKYSLQSISPGKNGGQRKFNTIITKDLGMVQVVLEEFKVVGKNEVIATLTFNNNNEWESNLAVSHNRVRYGLSDGYKEFIEAPKARAFVIDDRNNKYEFSSSMGLGFGKTISDWTFIDWGKKIKISMTFKGTSSDAVGSSFTLNSEVHIAWNDRNKKQKDQTFLINFENIRPSKLD